MYSVICASTANIAPVIMNTKTPFICTILIVKFSVFEPGTRQIGLGGDPSHRWYKCVFLPERETCWYGGLELEFDRSRQVTEKLSRNRDSHALPNDYWKCRYIVVSKRIIN